ncbi:energy-coupling factor ABC transporter ATP-binding protein [Streptomyces lycii]|uniref:ABC transporter ATP-binding protein n=1 Tax=Streptomyces lycii TaxID=2654337 RepID=A0ABQ7FJY8_9ACTN|nr:ATP-binding cassette domain-containing protein [Streptomyces lycii]KAF4409155.1 ATP-binding cassette domain-containing protein [Streptomyces lycii]
MTTGSAPPVVELAEAGYGYEDGPTVFRGLTFAVRGGRALALLGRNGSGKTTLLRLLTGGLRPTSGELRVDGVRVGPGRAALTRLRTSVQLVLQDPDDQLFAASVGQDVSFGPMNLGLPEEQVGRRVEESLEALGIAALRDRPTHLLSHGQRKRAAIAGAVAMRPRVLVLDEPTAGLDPHGQEQLLDVLAGLQESGTTVVMTTHDVDLALRWADDAAILAPGGPYTGPVGDLLGDSALLARAGLRQPWGQAAARVLRAHGLPGGEGDAPRTPEELLSLAGRPGGAGRSMPAAGAGGLPAQAPPGPAGR